MTVTLTSRAPRQIFAGDSIEFLVPVPSDYSDWTGSARLTGPASAMDATSCDTEGSDLHVHFKGQGDAPKTADLPAGQYTLTVWATDDDDRKTIAQFPITVFADASVGTPKQMHAIRMLAIIEAAIIARVSGNSDGGIESYNVDGTDVTKVSLEQLERLRNKYSAEVAALNNPNAPIGRVKFGFNQAGQIPDMRRRFG